MAEIELIYSVALSEYKEGKNGERGKLFATAKRRERVLCSAWVITSL